MNDADLLSGYIADMRFRNLSEGTIRVRLRYLSFFVRDVGFTDATEQKIVLWLSRPISPKTRAMWISTLNSFYTWANHNHLFADTPRGDGWNPVADIGKPRLHARSPRPMEQDDLQRALSLADDRMRAWLLLGSLAGCRCMEIAGLSREDVREAQGVLRLLGKGDKERFVPLHPDVLAALQQFGMPREGRLWGEEDAASVSRKINRFLHKDVGTKSTAHTLRHYFGTVVYRSSQDLRLTQELMGHSSPQTTAGYAAADQTKAAGVVSNLSI